MCGNDNACSTANFGKLLNAHSVSKRITALSTILLRYRNTKETVFSHLLYGFYRESLFLVNLLSKGFDFLLGEIMEQCSRHLMLFT